MDRPLIDAVVVQPGDSIRQFPPGRYLKDPDVWELRRDGRVVGRVESAQLGSKSLTVFFHAFAVHPETGKTINLELGRNFAERVAKVFAFIEDPNADRGRYW